MEEHIAQSERLYHEINLKLGDFNVTGLRKIERKVASQVKAASWQISQFYSDGVSQSSIDNAERLDLLFRALAEVVAKLIAEAKSRPRRTGKEGIGGRLHGREMITELLDCASLAAVDGDMVRC